MGYWQVCGLQKYLLPVQHEAAIFCLELVPDSMSLGGFMISAPPTHSSAWTRATTQTTSPGAPRATKVSKITRGTLLTTLPHARLPPPLWP